MSGEVSVASMRDWTARVPELYLKRIAAGGLERIYEIGKNFPADLAFVSDPKLSLAALAVLAVTLPAFAQSETPAAPAPKPSAIGRLPASADMVVIMIGRKRIRQP